MITYDDLSKQAVAYRQLSLLLRTVLQVVKLTQVMFSTYIPDYWKELLRCLMLTVVVL